MVSLENELIKSFQSLEANNVILLHFVHPLTKVWIPASF